MSFVVKGAWFGVGENSENDVSICGGRSGTIYFIDADDGLEY